jgi:tetratricopeptide (TPR) repeat protein
MVRALTRETERLAALVLEDDMTVRSALDVSYRALYPHAAPMYRVMALFPGVRFGAGGAAAAAAVPSAEARRDLNVLTDANLLDDAPDGQYRFHDLTRLHAREMAELHEPAEEGAAIARRTLDWYLALADASRAAVLPHRHDPGLQIGYRPAEPARFAGPGTALDWLDRELPNVMALTRLAASQRHHTAAWQLSDTMRPLFLYRGHHAERLQLDELALTAAHDATGEAKMLNRLGLAVMDLGQYERAQGCYEQAQAIWERLGDASRVIGSRRRLGMVGLARNRPADATGLLTQALDGYTQIGDTRKTALTLSDLAEALLRAGSPADAITRLLEASALLAQAPDPYNQARTLTRLGTAHEQAGDLEAARRYLRRALNAMRDISSPGERRTPCWHLATSPCAQAARRSPGGRGKLRQYAMYLGWSSRVPAVDLAWTRGHPGRGSACHPAAKAGACNVP